MFSLVSGEQIISVIRRHKIWLAAKIFSFLVILACPFLIYYSALKIVAVFFYDFTPLNKIYFFAVAVFYFFSWIYFTVEFLDYWLDVWIVTDKKVIILEQRGLFNRNILEVPVNKIQDVTTNINGILQTMLGFGTVIIQTASEKSFFKFESVPHPEKVKNFLIKLMHD